MTLCHEEKACIDNLSLAVAVSGGNIERMRPVRNQVNIVMNADEREMLRRVARLSDRSQGGLLRHLLKREAERLEHEAAFVGRVDAVLP